MFCQIIHAKIPLVQEAIDQLQTNLGKMSLGIRIIDFGNLDGPYRIIETIRIVSQGHGGMLFRPFDTKNE